MSDTGETQDAMEQQGQQSPAGAPDQVLKTVIEVQDDEAQDVKAVTQVTVTLPQEAADKLDINPDGDASPRDPGADGDPRQRKSSTSSTSSLTGAWGGLGTSWWEERSRSVTPSGGVGGVHCLDVPPTGGWAARRWSGGESPSPRGALSPLLELRRPHCTLNCSTCNTILEEKYRHTRSRRASFVKEAGKSGGNLKS